MARAVQLLIDAVSLGALYALLALGIALLFGIMNLINFAHGELLMIGGYALVLLAATAVPLMLLGTVVIVVIAALLHGPDRVQAGPLGGRPPC